MSAEDLVAAVRVHLDRVHDAVRRLGCNAAASVEVVETSAVDLVEVVAGRPETVEDAVGWWFARARALGRRVAARAPDLPLGGGVLSVDQDQQVLSEALDQLPERERVALLLRDSYDLPALSVGAALGLDEAAAMELVGRARLAFLPLVDDEPSPVLSSHQSDLGALARLGEGGQIAARDATVRRHALSCESCRAVTDAQQRAHLLLTGLTVVALPEADRVGVLAHVEEQAYAVLPTTATLMLRGREEQELQDEQDPRVFSPLLVLLALVLCAVAGLGLGLLLSRSSGPTSLVSADGRLPPGVVLASPPAGPAKAAPPPTVVAPAPQTTVFLVPASPPPSPSPLPVPSLTPAPVSDPDPDPLGITLTPDSGPNGANLTVTGLGWPPGVQVTIEYLDTLGEPTGSRSVVLADARGQFSAQLIAQDPANLPGPHAVEASDGTQTTQASYDAQT